jgi:hypothetical protein
MRNISLALMKNCSLAYFIILLTLFRWVLYLRRRKGELFCFTCLWSRNNEDKANILNNFFCSITEIENSNVLTPDFHDRTGNRIDTLHITSDEVKDILECLQLILTGGVYKL